MAKNRFWNLDRKIPKIKICGIKTIETAYNAYLLGADALGFHLWSWDCEELQKQKIQMFNSILSYMPEDISNFLLTDIKDPDKLLYILNKIPNIDTLQIQGKVAIEELEEICSILKEKVSTLYIVKSIPATIEDLPFSLRDLENIIDGIVLDSGWYGGSGRSYNWHKSVKIIRDFTKPVILAGGLNTKNVKKAIEIIQPYGVDVETGVEDVIKDKAGNKIKVKNFIKIIEFIKTIREI